MSAKASRARRRGAKPPPPVGPPNERIREGRLPRAQVTVPEDAELAAIARCLEELERLDAPSRRRLIDYLGRRYPAPAGAEKRAHPVVAKEPGNPTVPESPNEAWQRPVGGAGGPWVPYHLPGDWGGFGMYL